jgi:hypothetical protein
MRDSGKVNNFNQLPRCLDQVPESSNYSQYRSQWVFLWEFESRVFSPEIGILASFLVFNSRDNDVSAVKFYVFLFWTSFVPRDNAICRELTYGKRCETREKLIKLVNSQVFASLLVINSQRIAPLPSNKIQGTLNNNLGSWFTGKDARYGKG